VHPESTVPSGASVGHDEHGGDAAAALPCPQHAPHWSLEAVAFTGRPHHLEVSPDRAHAAFVIDEGIADVWTVALPGRPPERLTAGRAAVGRHADTAPTWSPDGRSLAFVDRGRVHIVDVGTGRVTDLAAGDQPVWVDARRLVATTEHGGNAVLVTFAANDPWPRAIGRAAGDYGRACPSPDGRFVAVAFRPADEPGRRELRLVDVERREERVLTGDPEVDLEGPVWAPDGDTIAFVSNRSGWREIHLLELSDTRNRVDGIGVAERQLTADGADFDDLTWDADAARILATRARGGVTDVVTIDPGNGWIELVAAGGSWSSPRWFAQTDGDTRDLGVVAVHESETSPPGVVLLVPGDNPNESVFRAAPRAVDAAPHVASVAVSFPSEDGTTVHGRLLRPPAANAARRVPLVVAVHGGPAACAGDEWDGVAQYFVDKGYGWLTPNYRGSTGYGRDFERAGHGGCGVDDAADCLFAGEFAAKLDWVDDERIVIVGRSYGGFLAVNVLTRDPGRRFAAGVSISGDSDLLTTWSRCDRSRRRELETTMGHPSGYRDAYRAASALPRLEAIAAPVLIAHGELDTRVPFESSQRLVARLREIGVTYEYVTYRTEAHTLASPASRLHLARRIERFLDWHLM
jgi:dipeptidyl aminopeptidase/acylaminoacyl peptidase